MGMNRIQLEKAKRIEKVNELLQTIASCGRKFFAHNERIARFEIDYRGRLWFVDAWWGARIYVAYTDGKWIGFSEGGTMRELVIRLRDHIAEGKLVNAAILGPWNDWYAGADLWGYGDDMKIVREKAETLGILYHASKERA